MCVRLVPLDEFMTTYILKYMHQSRFGFSRSNIDISDFLTCTVMSLCYFFSIYSVLRKTNFGGGLVMHGGDPDVCGIPIYIVKRHAYNLV